MTEQMETIGCDLGDKESELCILLASGKVERPKAVKTTRAAMHSFFTRPRAHVVIEIGTHSRWVSQVLRDLGHEGTSQVLGLRAQEYPNTGWQHQQDPRQRARVEGLQRRIEPERGCGNRS